MDMPIQLVIVGMIVVFIMAMMVTGTEHTIPMYTRARFDDTCNNYLAIIERDGGLSTAQKDALRAELNHLGIINITIDAPTNGNWGERATLKVEGDYIFQTTDYGTLSKNNVTKPITYENSTVILNLD
jgi:hypothetical protein